MPSSAKLRQPTVVGQNLPVFLQLSSAAHAARALQRLARRVHAADVDAVIDLEWTRRLSQRPDGLLSARGYHNECYGAHQPKSADVGQLSVPLGRLGDHG